MALGNGQPYARVDFIPQSGTLDMASGYHSVVCLLQLYTFRHAHTDGRISNPLLFIFSSPSGKNLKNNQNKNKN